MEHGGQDRHGRERQRDLLDEEGHPEEQPRQDRIARRTPPDGDEAQRQERDGERRRRDVEARRAGQLMDVGGRQERDRGQRAGGGPDPPCEGGVHEQEAHPAQRIEEPPHDQRIDPERDRWSDDDGRPHRRMRQEVVTEYRPRSLPLDHAVADADIAGLVERHSERRCKC
jgi:hypothetical protein